MNTANNQRRATITRATRETNIELTLNLDGSRQLSIRTGLGFFDHMLTALSFHAGWDLQLVVEGDLHVDDHHTIEDCGLSLGSAIREALGDCKQIQRFAHAYAPLDEALARAVVDVSGRPHAGVALDLKRDCIGEVACENLTHFFQSLAMTGQFTLHLDALRGENDHHRAEAAFKACALAFRQAFRRDASATGSDAQVPSTKGVL